MKKRRAACALAAIGVISIALRLPFLSVPLTSDEGGYAYTAHWMLRGAALYRDLWFDRPQGIFIVYAAILQLFGESVEAIRLGAAVCNAASVVLLFILGRRLFGRGVGIAAAGLFAVTTASPVLEGFTANGELFMNLPVIACVLLAARRQWFLAGLVCALASVIKPTALASAVPPLVVLAMGELWREPLTVGGPGAPVLGWPDSWRARLRPSAPRLGKLALGGLAGLAPFAVHGLATDPAGYVYAVAGFRVQAHSAFSVGEALVVELFNSAPSALLAALPVWALAAVAVWLRFRRRQLGLRLAIPLDEGAGVGLALFAGSVAGAAAGGYWYWHYFVGLLPGACLLAGDGLVWLAQHAPRRRLVTAGFGLASLAALAFNARVVGATPEQTSWNLYHRPAYLASSDLAHYLRTHTREGDRIFATFAQADLYELAGRRSASRQLYWTEINRVPGAFEHLLKELDDPKQRPVYVVAIEQELEQPGRAAPFWKKIDQLYRRETVIHGFAIYRLRTEAVSEGAAPADHA